MALSSTATQPAPSRTARSAGAIVAGIVAVIALSLGTDQLLHTLEVYPPWGQPMEEPRLLLLALLYRTVFGVFGSYLAARLAPSAPMRHALIVGGFGFVMSILGVVAALTTDLGPLWYSVAIAVVTLPGAWLGGVLYRPR